MADDLASTSFWTSAGIMLVALFLGLRQWYERLSREPDLSSADRSHFQRQDTRRALGVGVMVVLAAALSIGARVNPKLDGRANPSFVEIWFVVLALLVVLVILAVLDSLATFVYARRQRRSLARERGEFLREVRRQSGSGSADPPAQGDG